MHKDAFKHNLFDLVKINSGPFTLLVQFVWTRVNAAIRTLMTNNYKGGSRSASKRSLVQFICVVKACEPTTAFMITEM